MCSKVDRPGFFARFLDEGLDGLGPSGVRDAVA
jgi:hypothetical protein